MNAEAILVAADHDMKAIAKSNGIGTGRFKTLNLVKLSCRTPEAADKVNKAISVIEHEWDCHVTEKQRRLFVEIKDEVISIRREFKP